MRTPSRFNTSNWKTKAGNETLRYRSRRNRPSMSLDRSMRLPPATALIEVWERGSAQHWVDRALSLLAFAYPDKTLAELQELTISERDRLLLNIHGALFGSPLSCYAECQQCETHLEFGVDINDLVGDANYSSKSNVHEITSNDFLVRFSAPDSADLAAVRGCVDVASARRLLLERCILEAK